MYVIQRYNTQTKAWVDAKVFGVVPKARAMRILVINSVMWPADQVRAIKVEG